MAYHVCARVRAVCSSDDFCFFFFPKNKGLMKSFQKIIKISNNFQYNLAFVFETTDLAELHVKMCLCACVFRWGILKVSETQIS